MPRMGGEVVFEAGVALWVNLGALRGEEHAYTPEAVGVTRPVCVCVCVCKRERESV